MELLRDCLESWRDGLESLRDKWESLIESNSDQGKWYQESFCVIIVNGTREESLNLVVLKFAQNCREVQKSFL